ncbi:hypothetical protein NJB1728216S_15230, partial [Mycobacterium marinum]
MGAFSLPQLGIPSLTIPSLTIPAGTTVGGFDLPALQTRSITVGGIDAGGFRTPAISTVSSTGYLELPTVTIPGIRVNNFVAFLPNNIEFLQTGQPGVIPQIGGLEHQAYISTGDIVIQGFNISGIGFSLPQIDVGAFTLPELTIPPIGIPPTIVGAFTLPEITTPVITTPPLVVDPVAVAGFTLPEITTPEF